MTIFTAIDVETNGLYGLPFIVAFVTYEMNDYDLWDQPKKVGSNILRCPISGEVDVFVKNNVLPANLEINENCKDLDELLDKVYEQHMFLNKLDKGNHFYVAHCPYPVETHLFRLMIERQIKKYQEKKKEFELLHSQVETVQSNLQVLEVPPSYEDSINSIHQPQNEEPQVSSETQVCALPSEPVVSRNVGELLGTHTSIQPVFNEKDPQFDGPYPFIFDLAQTLFLIDWVKKNNSECGELERWMKDQNLKIYGKSHNAYDDAVNESAAFIYFWRNYRTYLSTAGCSMTDFFKRKS